MTVLQQNTAKNLAVLSNGTYNSGKGQAFDDYLWDTILVPSSPAKALQFFKVPIGGQYGSVSGDSKTEVETSMEDTGKLPAGQSFLITGITVSLVSNLTVGTDATVDPCDATIAAYRLIMGMSVWELKFSNTEYSWRDSGSIFLPSVFEVGPSSSGAPAQTQQVGSFVHYNWVKVATKVPVSELVSFSVNARFQSGNSTLQTALEDAFGILTGSNTALRVQLKGMLTRKI